MLLLRQGKDADRLLDWLRPRLARLCFRSHREVFVDQLWLNLVPGLFAGVAVNRHEGTNVGYWNLHERPLTRDAEGIVEVRGQRLNSVHFSRWDPHRPEVASIDHPRIHGGEVWRDIAREYAELLFECGFGQEAAPYLFGSFAGGGKIDRWMRRHFHRMWFDGEWEGGSPFDNPARFQGLARMRAESPREIVAGTLEKVVRMSRR
jgi:hypothetical protein